MTNDPAAWFDEAADSRDATAGTSTDPAVSRRDRRDSTGRRRHTTGHRRKRNIVAAVILILLLALAGLAVVSALQARTAYTELRAAMPQVRELRSQALNGDVDAAAATASDLQDRTRAAREALAGPHWTALAKVPGVGPNVHAAREVTVVVDDLATDALPDLVSATQAVNPANLAIVDGRIDLDPIITVAPQVVAADGAVTAATDRLAAIDTDGVASQITDALADLETQLTDLSALTTTAARAVQLALESRSAASARRELAATA